MIYQKPASVEKEDFVENSIGTKFKNRSLLHKALLHRSYLNENPKEEESNERLEFLGDAILEFVVSSHLYEQFKKEDEGHLTALRSQLVNTTALANIANELRLGDALYLSRGEEKSGGRQNQGLLANTVEALIGAIFTDQGIESAENFIKNFVLKRLPEVVKKSLKDPKSLFQEYVQAADYSTPIYRVVSETGPDHAKVFTVEVVVDKKPYAQGTGSSKQVAAQVAAENALEVWKQ